MTADSRELYWAPLDEQLRAFIDEHRTILLHILDGLSEDEVRMRLVPSKTTLLGLVKHAVFVERVWFEERVTGASRAELGIAAGPDESFDLDPEDTSASVTAELRKTIAASRRTVQGLDMDSVLICTRRGTLSLRWVCLHVLRELAQHCGHAEILREQILAARTAEPSEQAPGATGS